MHSILKQWGGIGPRKKNNDVRSRQGKIVNPKSGSVTKDGVQVKGPAVGSEKQHKQTGPKYKGPNYKQSDPNVEKFGSK